MSNNTCPKEDDECYTFVAWLELKKLKFSHVPNSTFTKNWAVKMKNKRMGVRPGVPDYIIVTKKGLLFVEMKRLKGGVVSEFQKDWIASLNACRGVEAKICRGNQEAIDFVSEFL